MKTQVICESFCNFSNFLRLSWLLCNKILSDIYFNFLFPAAGFSFVKRIGKIDWKKLGNATYCF